MLGKHRKMILKRCFGEIDYEGVDWICLRIGNRGGALIERVVNLGVP